MARKHPYRTPVGAPARKPVEPELGPIEPGGIVHRLYGSLTPEQRHAVISSIGLKYCQRVGHRHKVAELRTLTDLGSEWTVVDDWLNREDAADGPRAVGDLFEPLIKALIDRARELLGEHADDPTAEHLAVMAEALAAERSEAEARVLLAAVVEFDFTAAPAAMELASAQPRFALPAAD